MNFSAALALGHKPTSSGNIHSPHPHPEVSGFSGFPLPASPFQGWGVCVCAVGAGRGLWGVGLRKEEAGCGLTDTLFSGHGGGDLPPCFLGRQPEGGGFGNLAHSFHGCLLPHMAPSPDSCSTLTNGALCSQDKGHASYPDLDRASSALLPSWPQRRWCHFPGGDTEA